MSMLRGWLGKKMTSLGMGLLLKKKVYRRFHNIIVPTPDGTVPVDELIVSPYGLFVVQIKNIKGKISTPEEQPNWSNSYEGKKHLFPNPVRLNAMAAQYLSMRLSLDPSMLHPIVFFIGFCSFKEALPSTVIKDGLRAHILGFKDSVLSETELRRVINALNSLKSDPFTRHSSDVRPLKARLGSPTCPKCGSPLAARTLKTGPSAGSKILGCSSYPRCQYIKTK